MTKRDPPTPVFFESLRNTRIGGRYVVEEILGSGGMGIVASARYPELDQRVAVKFLRPELGGKQSISARFLREAQMAARVESPHLVRVFDFGRLESGTPYMVMELLSGRDLAAEIHRTGPMTVEHAVDLILQTCVGLGQVHASGVIHRDLKPSNIFLSIGRGDAVTVKILDFGISKQASATPSTELTDTEHLLGTPRYMSPEQIKDAKRIDVRTDLWSLGVILYQMLTGQLPFKQEGDGVGELFGIIMFTDPIPPRAVRPELPPQLEDVVLRCLKRDRNERYATVAELATALAPFAAASTQHRVDEVQRALRSLRPPSEAAERPRRSEVTTADDSHPATVPSASVPPQPPRAHLPLILGGVAVAGVAAMLLAPAMAARTTANASRVEATALVDAAPPPRAAAPASHDPPPTSGTPSAVASSPSKLEDVRTSAAPRGRATQPPPPKHQTASATPSASVAPVSTGRDRGI